MNAAERPILYLLPGLLCDDSIFAAQRDALSDLYEVRSPDFRGHDSITGMAWDVLSNAPPRFALAGFSMGGRVALEIMRLAPQHVERLCLFDTGVKPRAPDEAERRLILVDLARRTGMDALAAAWLPPMLAPANRANRALTDPLVAMIRRYSPSDYAKQIQALLDRPDARPVLATIHCPTLILCGALDEWSPPAQHREMAAAIPGSRLEVIADAGHFVSVEQPDAFTRALREFLAAPLT